VRTRKCTRVADRAFLEIKISWRQPGDFGRYRTERHARCRTHETTLITPTTGTGFERSKAPILGLPTNAADIDFMLRPTAPVSAYSFNTDETSFVDWSERYLGLEDSREGHVSIQGIDVLSGTTTMIESPDGIAYSWSEEDRGQYTLFDRKQGRAYYFAHTR